MRTDIILAEQPDKKEVIKTIAKLLQRLSKLYQLPNWSEENAVILAEWVFDTYRYDSMDDLIECLSKPPQTYDEHGNIESNWRLTPDRIQKWMSVQLEKTAIKRENHRQPSALEMLPDDKLKEIQEAILQSDVKPVVPITEQEIKREGREKPAKPVYIQPDENYLRMQELKMQFGRECCDLHTGRPKEGMPQTFEDYLKTIK